MFTDLTIREKEVLSYIISFKLVNGFSPTFSEIAKALNASKQTVYIIAQQLRDKDFIAYTDKASRTILVLKF